jgi:hypothetical protein
MPNFMSVGGRLVFTAFLALGFSSCSDESRSLPAIPTAPSATTGPAATADSGSQSPIRNSTWALRPFPGRQDAYRFRTENLEPAYRAMGRGRFQTFVDPEGSVIWVGE